MYSKVAIDKESDYKSGYYQLQALGYQVLVGAHTPILF